MQEYKYRIELHTHTYPASGDSVITPEEMVQIYAERGFDGVVISNHFYSTPNVGKKEKIARYINDIERAQKEAEKYHIKVYFGAEIRFDENKNDYLVVGMDSDILSVCYDFLPKGLEVFRQEVKLSNSLLIHAHPFRDGMVLMNPELLDGVETFNMYPRQNSRVSFAVRYAKENNISITTPGSDIHYKNQGFETVCALRTRILPHDSFELAAILKSGDYVFEIGEQAIVLS